jgi:hypothetical protein
MSDVSPDFDRVYKLTAIAAPETIDVQGFSASFFESLETITEVTDHRIQFKVEKHLKKVPNQAEVTLTNLAFPSRESFVNGRVRVRLEAGYGNDPRLLFLGDLRFGSNEHVGTEWLTKLQLGDGARAYADARHNRSYAKGTPMTTIISDLAKAFGTALPAEVAKLDELKTRIATGEVVTGYAADELTRLLDPFGMEWSFQTGRLQILRIDDVVPGVVRVISQDDGMIGSPVIDPPKISAPQKAPRRGKGREPRVPKLKVKHTLYPEITPGEKIELRSRSINGVFRVDVVTHEGDNFGTGDTSWTSTIEGSSV